MSLWDLQVVVFSFIYFLHKVLTFSEVGLWNHLPIRKKTPVSCDLNQVACRTRSATSAFTTQAQQISLPHANLDTVMTRGRRSETEKPLELTWQLSVRTSTSFVSIWSKYEQKEAGFWQLFLPAGFLRPIWCRMFFLAWQWRWWNLEKDVKWVHFACSISKLEERYGLSVKLTVADEL